MNREPNTQYVLSLSYGKDSIACLAAIEQLGLPLDRIVHAEVWATDTIPADLPPMVEFKKKADAIIKDRWGIEVEHICAMRGGNARTTKECSTECLNEESLSEQSKVSPSNKEVGARNSNLDQRKLTYQDIFYRPINKPRTKVIGGGDSKQRASRCRELHGATDTSKRVFLTRIYGFPMRRGQWCNNELKMAALRFSSVGRQRKLVYQTQAKSVFRNRRCARRDNKCCAVSRHCSR